MYAQINEIRTPKCLLFWHMGRRAKQVTSFGENMFERDNQKIPSLPGWASVCCWVKDAAEPTSSNQRQRVESNLGNTKRLSSEAEPEHDLIGRWRSASRACPVDTDLEAAVILIGGCSTPQNRGYLRRARGKKPGGAGSYRVGRAGQQALLLCFPSLYRCLHRNFASYWSRISCNLDELPQRVVNLLNSEQLTDG
jgi:hypothetical protein